MSENAKRSVHVRFDQHTHDRLEALTRQSGESVTEVVRNLVGQALDQEALAHLLAGSRALLARLDRLEQGFDHARATTAQALDRIAALVCAVDAHAARRGEVAHARERRLWNSARWGIWETQGVIKTIMLEALMINGAGYEDALASYDELKEAAGQEFDVYQPKIDADLAALAATAPPVLDPPAPFVTKSASARLPDESLCAPGGERPLPAAPPTDPSQPSLFTSTTPDPRAEAVGNGAGRATGSGAP